jgi:hypothetical protein
MKPSFTLNNAEAGHDAKPGKNDARRIHRLLNRYARGSRNKTDILLAWFDMRLSCKPTGDKHSTSNKVIFT